VQFQATNIAAQDTFVQPARSAAESKPVAAAARVSPGFVADRPGTYRIRVTLSAKAPQSAGRKTVPTAARRSTDTVTVTVQTNEPYGIPLESNGPGGASHLFAELAKTMLGIEMTHVPYKGSAPALNDLVGGHIQMMFCDVPPAMSLIQAGKIRALGVTTKERVPAVADIPPLAEVGVPGYDTASWHTVTTTAGVPKPIVDTLYGNIREIMRDPSVTDTLAKEGALPQASPSPEEMKDFVAREITRWGKVVEAAGLAGSE